MKKKSPLDGKKTYLGAAIVAVVAIVKYFGLLDDSTVEMLQRAAESIIVVGLAHKLQKAGGSTE